MLKRLTPKRLQMARDITAAIQQMPGFTGDADHSPAAISTAEGQVDTDRDSEVQTKNAADTARDRAAASEQEFYNRVLRVREMVVGQFGSSSDQAAAVGLKKKSERKRPKRTTPSPTPTP